MDDLGLQEIVEQGRNNGRGNLLGIQPFMKPDDYASEGAFYHKIKVFFQAAIQKEWLGERTIVLLPEYLGTWLVVADENPAIYSAQTISTAMRWLVRKHLGAFIKEMLHAKEKDRITASLFRVKANHMARIYQSVFSRLAKEYAVTIVAGSILLPDPKVADGRIVTGKGELYNACFVFQPNGRLYPQFTRKGFLIKSEQAFAASAPIREMPVYETPAGKLGVLICADSWFPEAYRQIKAQGADLVVVPSASSHGYLWQQPWRGYSGWPAPDDVDRSDIGSLTERQAWGKYALAGRFARSGAIAGMNVFLYGDLWDLEFNGGRWRMVGDQTNLEGSCDGPAMINLWV